MDTAKQAIIVLLDAERRLRELLASGAAAGEYDSIQQITDWARILGSLVREAQQIGACEVGAGRKTAPSKSSRIAAGGAATQHLEHDRGGREQVSSTGTGRVQRAPAKDEYPRFFRQGDQLVKIGWSRKAKAEYEHKAPRHAVDALTAAIARRSGNGKLFTVEDLLPLRDPQDHSEIPSYQAYVVLAWLKLARLVKQHGRRGYTVRKSLRLADAAATSWQQLPEKVV